ncbi:hypothetical protein chiPu_0016839 [Chiloscyllium punctatum]|uniref:Uncharacterized protein n=1 Tax=Chiloscyllium punctatum TaxID=137246 RepID=A0A401T6S0_CHIPU|nr:hypothetical protein [Chiloscyllium punctatum]
MRQQHLLLGFAKLREKIEAAIEPISAILKKHEQEIQTLDRTREVVKQRTTASETMAEVSGGRIRTLENQVRILQEQVDDLENKSRRKNVWLVGLPVHEEGEDLVGYLEKWLPNFLGLELEQVWAGSQCVGLGRITMRRSGPDHNA